MNAGLHALLVGYASVALLLTAGYAAVRLVLGVAPRLGVLLSAGQVLRLGRATLLLALVLFPLSAAVRGLIPAAPLFTFDRSVVQRTGRIPGPAWAAAPKAGSVVPGAASSATSPIAVGAVVLFGVVVAALWTRQLVRHGRLLRRLEVLPRVRQVGRVAVALGGADTPAFSAWFPRLDAGPSAWVVVPSALLEDAEALRLTVTHELQHHRQRDTVLAFGRMLLGGLFFWNPVVHAFSRWLAECQELACDEALVTSGRVRPHAYARCLLQSSLRTSPHSLPAGVAGMAHPTLRRIEMLFHHRPMQSHRPAALVAAVALLLTPLALWAQSATKGRVVTLEEAQALAQATNREGDIPVVVDAQVVERLNAMVATPKGRAFMRMALDNLRTHREALVAPLRAKGLPEGLLAVAVMESGVRSLPESQTSGMRAAGMWQFIPSTARRFGLTVSAERDERMELSRETAAAAAYLSELQARYGDWRLVLAAYNQGEQKVDRVIADAGSRDAGALARAGHLNNYASTVQAGLLILRNPQLLD
ncbi:MAG: M56 and MltD domain-containing protein [Myxococcaceae bacterium]|nr:M56 and MltD domain-containing protein [Myxococcaceae bacterium]